MKVFYAYRAGGTEYEFWIHLGSSLTMKGATAICVRHDLSSRRGGPLSKYPLAFPPSDPVKIRIGKTAEDQRWDDQYLIEEAEIE